MDESNKAPAPRALSVSPKGSSPVAHDGPSQKAAADSLVASEELAPDAPVPKPAQVPDRARLPVAPLSVGPSRLTSSQARAATAETPDATLELPSELVARIRDIVAERCRVAGLIEAAEHGRSEVKEGIFQKVRADYEAQLQAVRHAYEPLRVEAVGALTILRQEQAELQASLEHVEDELAELRFRFRVGEFGEDDLARAEKSRLAEVAACETRLERLRATFALADSLLGEDSAAPISAGPEATELRTTSAVQPEVPASATPFAPEMTRAQPEEGGLSGVPTPDEAPTSVISLPASSADIAEFARDEDTAGNEFKSIVSGAVEIPGMEYADHRQLPAPPALPALPRNQDSLPLTHVPGAATGVPSLVMMTSAGEEAYPITTAGLSIGRSKTNHIVLAEPGVSRKHAVISWVDGQPTVEDRSSGGGVVLNGQFIERAALKPGDLIQIVSFALRVRG